MIDHFIFNTPCNPSKQIGNGIVVSVKAPRNDLMSVLTTHVIEPNEQLTYLRNVDVVTRVTEFTHRISAQPVGYRLRRYIRLQCSHGYILSASLSWDTTSLGRMGGEKIEAENLFIWKRPTKVISNA
jgi:hypothetical protein